ncbi:hypothetical protein Hanom_Chr13g01209991 [Helianthus anomalus]
MQSITTLLIICARRAVIASRKLKNNSRDSPVIHRPKKLIANISNKAITMRHRKQEPTPAETPTVVVLNTTVYGGWRF